MFPDIGGVELIIVAVVALLVVKPKDLPVMLRKVGEFMGKARRMASDFRASFEDMARQTELDDLRRQVEEMRSKAADPIGLNDALQETGAEIQAGLADPNFDYGAQTEHVPWEEPAQKPAPEAEPAKRARKRAAPKAAAAPIVVGGPATKAATRKAPAKQPSAAGTSGKAVAKRTTKTVT